MIESKNKVDERHLLELAKSDPTEFRVFYDLYFEQIFKFVLRRMNDLDVSKDITQQVFLNALMKLDKYEHRGFPFSSFLYRIAINECNQYFKDRKKIRYVTIDSDFHDSLTEEFSLEEDTFEMDRLKLNKVLQILAPKELTLIELRFFEKYSFKEIGTMMDLTENVAKVRTYRLLTKIRKIYQKSK